jgi:CubicO group peptidase (beta-lactamase class C family)
MIRTRRLKTRQILLVAFISCVPFLITFVPATPEPGPESIAAQVAAEIQTRMPEWLKQKETPGAAIAVVDDKAILWQGVYGHTSRSKDKPVTPRTLFSIQSMSKSFTALGVLMAVQDGLLDLDAPITDYLPDFRVQSRFEDNPEQRMTLRHLLSHRAGFTHEAPVGSNYDSRPATFTEHVLSFSDTWLRYPVGYRYSYSNMGIDLAGYILEKMSGQPFAAYIRDKVLVPLGMNDSTLDIATILKTEDRALGHLKPTDIIAGGIPVEIPMIPAGGVYTNVLDMAQYLMFHINEGRVDGRPLLRPDLMRAMHTVAFPEPQQRFGYGLGISVDHYGPEGFYSHGGGGYGFGSYMIMFPGLKLGIIYMANSEQGGQGIGWVTNLVFNFIAKSAGPPGPELEKPTIDTQRPLPPEDPRIQRLVGEYGNNVSVGQSRGVLGIAVGREFYPLSFYEDGGDVVGVFGKYSELRVKPSLDGQPGSLVHLNRLSGTVSYYDFHKPASSADRPGPGKPEWKPYLGIYRTLYWGRTSGSVATIGTAQGYLTYSGMRCRECRPGLFFSFDGEALDLRGTMATFRNIPLIRTKR